MAVASVVVALGIGGGLLALIGDQPTPVSSGGVSYVLPGEVVVQEDPLVVVSALGPEPVFDTGDLGTEIEFDVLDEVDNDIDKVVTVSAFDDSGLATITKITLVGRIGGASWVVVIRDGPNDGGIGGEPVEANVRSRALMSSESGGGAIGEVVPADGLDLIEPPGADEPAIALGAGYSAPVGWVRWDLVPPETAVVAFADSDTKKWMRPRAGVAVFPAEFDNGERFTIEALDSAGELLRSYSETVLYDIGTSIIPEPGDLFGTIRGADPDGTPVVYEPDGQHTVLLYGAEWCGPCREAFPEIRQAIGRVPRSVRVASVSHYNDDLLWPSDDQDWPYPRIVAEPNSPLLAVPGLPTIVVLDGDNAVESVGRGREEMFEVLDGLSRREAICVQLDAEAKIIAQELDQLAQQLRQLELVITTSPDERTREEAEAETAIVTGRRSVIVERNTDVERRSTIEQC